MAIFRHKSTSTDKIKLICIIGQLGIGGSEQQLYYFLREIDNERFSSKVVVTGNDGLWAKKIRDLGIEVLSIPDYSYPYKFFIFFRMLHKEKPDIVFSWSFHANIYLMAARILRVPTLGSLRNCLEGSGIPYTVTKRLCLFMPQKMLTNSSGARKELIHEGLRSEKVVFVPNAVDPMDVTPEQRKATRTNCGFSDDDFIIVGVGQLCQQKNFSFFIDVLSELLKNGNDVKGIIVGNGPLADNLKKRSEAAGLQQRLFFAGEVKSPRSIIATGNVFFLSSGWEGMPNVVMEAMSAGIPTVCTDVFGVRDLIRDGVEGFIIPLDDVVAARQKVEILIKDYSLRRRMGLYAAKRVQAFGPKHTYVAMETVVLQMIKEMEKNRFTVVW